ncbi:MAG: Rpn family recombination-promoting nuclease/putative transposase [Muribaculaceae bacterium]|nr:Rpn family recombination-promoting nuclease/putative transposase [Muribaculaceae bacterium]
MDVNNAPKIETPYINLQSDFGFKRAFGTVEFRNALLQFLDAALGVEIKVSDVKFHDKEMLPASEGGKRIVYDIYCTMSVPSGESSLKPCHLERNRREEPVTHHFILEMQNVYEPPFEERIFYYASKLVADQGKRGWSYDLDPVITIAITDFDFAFLSKRLVQDFRLTERNTGEVLTEKLRLLFFSLRQVPERWENCQSELQRLLFIIKNMENLDKNSAPYKDGKYEELFRAAESDQIAAEDVVPYSQSVERLRAYQAGIDYATEQSWVSGVEKGRAEGRAEGISSMIKNMYSNHMTVEAIAKIANISESEVIRIIGCN